MQLVAISEERLRMDRAEAEKVNALVSEMFERANDVLYIINNSGDAQLRKKAQQAIGTVIAEMDLEILEVLYKQFPDLRPPEMEEIKT
jgi:hypothetical protein